MIEMLQFKPRERERETEREKRRNFNTSWEFQVYRN